MGKRLLFIYNPNAGKAKIKNRLSDIVVEFARQGYEVIVKPTEKRGDATVFAREYTLRQCVDRIVCAGGDGTLNEVVTGVIQAGKSMPVGFIPAGTTNDFAFSLKLPSEPAEAAAFAARIAPVPSDVGEINGKTFIYTAAFGLFSDVSYDTPQNMKNIFGRMAYLLNGAISLHNIKVFRLRVKYEEVCDAKEQDRALQMQTDSETESPQEGRATVHREIEGEFISGMISNSDSVAGFKGIMGKGVRFDDGIFEMVLIRRPHNLLQVTDIVNELLSKKLDSDYIVYAKVLHVTVENEDSLSWSLDGEYGGDMTHSDIHILKQAALYLREP